MPNYKILHLSDIHFDSHKSSPRVSDIPGIMKSSDKESYLNTEIFKRVLEKKFSDERNTKFIIIVSGDLTKSAKKEEMEAACKFLKECAQMLKIDLNNIIVVPGNHDVLRIEDDNKSRETFIEYTKDFCTPFNENCYSNVDNKILIYPFNSTGFQFLKPDKYLRMKKLYNKFKCIMQDYPNIEETKLDRLNRIITSTNVPVRIAVLHHHVMPVYGREFRYFDVIQNAGKFLRVMQENCFSLVLHGHKHSHSIKFFQDADMITMPIGFYIIGGKNFEDININFNLIDITFDETFGNLKEILFSSKFLEGEELHEDNRTIDCTPSSNSKLKTDKFLELANTIKID